MFCLSAPVTNPCDRKKCEWLCLLSPSGPVCTCPNNYVADNGTCVERPTPTQSPFCKSAATLHCTACTHADHMPCFHLIKPQIKQFRFCIQNVGSWRNPPPSTAPPSGPCEIQCQNGGSCFLNARQVAKCRCQPSYTGERCEINQCRDYCKNGGTCTASHTGKCTTHLLRLSLFCPYLAVNQKVIKLMFSNLSEGYWMGIFPC